MASLSTSSTYSDMDVVTDDPDHPDPEFARLYARLPEASELEPWLAWSQAARDVVLYLGIGSGRLAAPLHRAGVALVGVDSHPGMLDEAARRLVGVELILGRIEDLRLDRTFALVMAPANILHTGPRLAAAARHVRPGGRLALELLNPHWLAAGPTDGVEVLAMTEAQACLRVPYPDGTIEQATVELVWPEAIEPWLAAAGLSLELMAGGADGDLEDDPSFVVLARPAPGRPAISC